MKTIGKELVESAIRTVAAVNQYHPIRDALAMVEHDGTPRLDAWLVRYAGAEDTPYVRAVGRKFLIQMVARVMRPGCKADHVLVLQGPQGIGKSTLCRTLAGDRYFSDTMPAINGGKDVMSHLSGLWLVELSELAPSRKSDAEDLKAFLTTQIDRYRAAFGRRDQNYPRQCVFMGTTNSEHFLKDVTGGRRFWPVACGIIDVDALARDRDQLIAEALVAFQAEESWWLDRDFETEHAAPVQDAAYEAHPWQEQVGEWLDSPTTDFDSTNTRKHEETVTEVMQDCLGLQSGQMNRAGQMEVSKILKRLQWEKKKTRRGKMVWRRSRWAHLEVMK
jgi:predicted P-loop ATPase